MATQIPTTYVTTYRENMRFALQQSRPKLASLAMREDAVGEKYLLEGIVGQDQMTERTTRNQDTQYGETTHDRVWVTVPNPGEYARLVDSQDKLKSGIELQGKYVIGGRNAHNRWWDDKFIEAFYGPILMGKEGTTSTPFDSNNVVPVTEGAAAASGLNISKIIAARTILRENYAIEDEDEDIEMYMAITAKQAENLLHLVQITNEDYAKMGGGPRISADGRRLVGLLGFNFVEIELGNPLFHNAGDTVTADPYRKVPFWTKNGMCMAVWQEEFSSVDQLPTKSFSTQVFHSTTVKATATDNGRRGYILCDES
jgi:hypothetical protein